MFGSTVIYLWGVDYTAKWSSTVVVFAVAKKIKMKKR